MMKYCGDALKYEIDVILESKTLECIDNRNSNAFDLKVKILCAEFVDNNLDHWKI